MSVSVTGFRRDPCESCAAGPLTAARVDIEHLVLGNENVVGDRRQQDRAHRGVQYASFAVVRGGQLAELTKLRLAHQLGDRPTYSHATEVLGIALSRIEDMSIAAKAGAVSERPGSDTGGILTPAWGWRP